MSKNGNDSRQDSCNQNPSKTTRQSKIRKLNNEFRRSGLNGLTISSRGVRALDKEMRDSIINTIRGIDELPPSNDPDNTDSLGSILVGEHLVFWTIEAFDLDLICSSRDPSDPNVTRRVMTIMLAEEYSGDNHG